MSEELVSFDVALPALRAGKRVRRASWPADQTVELQSMGRAVLIDGRTTRTMTWFTPDILAVDWELAT